MYIVWFQKLSILPPQKVIGNSLGEEGFKSLELYEGQCEAKLEFPGGCGVQNKKPSVGGVWIFSGTTHFELAFVVDEMFLV